MNILIVGSNGFIGSNLKYYFKLNNKIKIFEHKRNNSYNSLKKKIKFSDVVLHFGGENRSKKINNFFVNNYQLSKFISQNLKKNCHIIYASTTKIKERSPYGKSKLKAENILKENQLRNKYRLSILRLPNVYGRWSKPNYNSVVTTFCYNSCRNLKSEVHDLNHKLSLLYIDDLIDQIERIIKHKKVKLFPKIKNVKVISLKLLHNKIYSFNNKRINLNTDLVKTSFDKKLYSTFLSYLPESKFILKFKKNEDQRGNFSELLKSKINGQVSYCTINPGQTRGNHFHFTKVERFFPILGKGKIIYKNIVTQKEKKYNFDSRKPLIFETIPGWSHKLVNTTKNLSIFILWTNEIFDIKKPDTYFYDI